MESKNSISNWSKEKLEDHYLRLYDDYLTLKKHACKQEERIKKMATKILRLANDKKESNVNGIYKEDYQEQIEILERKNATLTRKLALLQNQLNLHKQRISSTPLSARKISSATIQTTSRNSCIEEKSLQNSNVIQTLRLQNTAFEKTIQKLLEQLKERDELINQLKQELQFKEKLHTNDLVVLGEQFTSKQRVVLQENLDLIRTQRELREKQLQINNLEIRLHEIETNYDLTKTTNRQLINEIERLTHESSQLEQKLFCLQSDNNTSSKQQLKLLELQYAYDDAKRENQALKESNEKLIANAFSTKSDQNWTLKEQKLRGQINHLEIMVHNLQQQLQKEQYQQQKDLPVEEQIISNKQQTSKLESTPMKQKHNTNCQEQPPVTATTTTTTQMFAQITGYSIEELEEAVMILRERKSKIQSTDGDLLNLPEQNRDSLKQLTEMDTLHIDTINELDKTRKLLNIQYKINKDYQIEINELTNKFNEYKCESEQYLNEYNKLLNIRTIHNKQLEKKLNELTYGVTVNKRKVLSEVQLSDDRLTEDTLKPGESLIELHIGQLTLSSTILDKYQLKSFNSIDNNQKNNTNEELSSIFLTWDFYDFETQTTPIMIIVQNSIDINMTIQYPVEVNDTFMDYLLKEPCIVEMHQVINSNYRTIANGTLNLSQLFTGKDDTIEITGQGSVIRRQGQLDLFLNFTSDIRSNIKEIKEVTDKIKLGTLNYWIRLCSPMPDSIRHYKERFQQLPGFRPIHNDTSIHQELQSSLDSSQNTLTIEIIKITNLSITNKINRLDYLPSTYFVYQFYNQLEYASDIMKENKAPIFNDCHTIQLEMNDKLDNYLRTESLKIYILDSTDPVPETSCLGLATIPLIGLIHNTQQIDGVFEIFSLLNVKQSFKQLGKFNNSINNNLSSCGLLHLKMYWLKPYTTTNYKTVVYNQLNMEETNDLEMEPVKQAAEKPYNDQPKSTKENNLQSSSSIITSFTSSVDKVHSSNNLSFSSTTKNQHTDDVDKDNSKVPGNIINKTDNQILVQSNDDHLMDNNQINSITSMQQFELKDNLNDKLNAPKPHPRNKTNELNNLTMNSLNNNSIKQNLINSNHLNIQLIQSTNSMITSTIQWGIDENHVKIELHGIQLTDLKTITNNNNNNQQLLNQIFVEYSFLGYKEPFETDSYPLIECQDDDDDDGDDKRMMLKANFYYTKTFSVDYIENYERRQYLASYLLPEDPNNGNIIFIIVTEPSTTKTTATTTQSIECEEIGYAIINIRQIVQNNRQIDHEFIPITANKTDNGETGSLHEIGRLCVSFYGLPALRAIIAEMPQVKLAI